MHDCLTSVSRRSFSTTTPPRKPSAPVTSTVCPANWLLGDSMIVLLQGQIRADVSATSLQKVCKLIVLVYHGQNGVRCRPASDPPQVTLERVTEYDFCTCQGCSAISSNIQQSTLQQSSLHSEHMLFIY